MFHSLILPDGRQIPEGNVAIRHVETEKQVSPAEQLLPGGVYPGKLKVKLLDPQGQVLPYRRERPVPKWAAAKSRAGCK